MYASGSDHGAYGQEPMALGSPSSPSHHGQSQYLPGYLLGDTSISASPQARLWSSSSGHSPAKSSGPLNRSASLTSPASGGSVFSHTPKSELRQRDLIGGRAKDKSGAPPVQGLFEQVSSPAIASPFTGTPDRRQVDLPRTVPYANTSQLTRTPGTPVDVQFDSSQVFNRSSKTPPSPAQVDPFYTQGEAISPEEILDETWITIYGFPSAASSFVLQQFSQYGNILKHVVSAEGNWMHLQYQSKLQAKRAMSKNGKVFGGSIMVGVTQCIDKKIMESANESIIRTSTVGTPSMLSQSTQDGDTSSMNSSRRGPMRPLTAAYRAASAENEVVQGSRTPQKHNGIFSKAMEYVFGW